MILPAVRDSRLITVHRGGSLSDDDHRSLALWAAECAEHVLGLFEAAEPSDLRPRQAIEGIRTWVRGQLPMMATRALGGHSMGAARPLGGSSRFAAYAAGQAACVAHVPEHDLGAAAYAIKAVRAAALPGKEDFAGREELRWQRDRLPATVRELVLEDQQQRNSICWFVFGE